MTFIDSNVFIIDLRYHRDKNFRANREFLEEIRRKRDGVTGLVNLLEVCGVMSFSLNADQLFELFVHFPRHYSVEVLPYASLEGKFPEVSLKRIFEHISRKISFGDALVFSSIEEHMPGVNKIVTWDKAHFEGKTKLKVLTPREYPS
jgi:predicted nucleic acid-binding protein